MSDEFTTRDGTGSALEEISHRIVQIHVKFYGRGPNQAKTIWQKDIVVCVCEDIFTRTETLLVAKGHFAEVRSSRIAFRDDVEPLFKAIVEEATGRPVRSFLSQVSEDGVASEVFLLGTASGPGDPPA